MGKGSGLGLAMVYGIVKQSGGYIWAYSEPGLGTTLKLYFPTVAETPTPQPMAEKPSTSIGGTVLVVEDDGLVRSMIRRALSETGFRVIEAANGEEALAVVQSDSTQIDAVLTDLACPSSAAASWLSGWSRSGPTFRWYLCPAIPTMT